MSTGGTGSRPSGGARTNGCSATSRPWTSSASFGTTTGARTHYGSAETMRTLRAMRVALTAHAERRGDRLEVRYLSGWIAMRSTVAGRAFAEVRPSRKAIGVVLLPPRCALRDPPGLAGAGPPSRGRGGGDPAARGGGRAASRYARAPSQPLRVRAGGVEEP